MTLVEMILYIAFLGAAMVLVINFMVQVVGVYQNLRAEREVVSNARLVMERVNQAISEAREIYQPTSRFGIQLGQLSLLSRVASTTEHSAGYLDFWVDNGQLWLRSEGQGSLAVSSPSVRIDSFYLEEIAQGLNREAVKVTLRVKYYSGSSSIASTTLYSTVSLRGAY